MKARAVFVPVLASIVTMGIGAQAAPWEDKLNKIYPAAKAEGKLVFNVRRIAEMGGKSGLAKFKKRFPGIDITFTGITRLGVR